jgi:hypothetical protein
VTLPTCPHCGEQLPAGLLVEAVTRLAMARPLSERAADRRARLRAEIAVLLAGDSTLSANAVVSALRARESASSGFRRQDVLQAVKTLRDPLPPVPEPGNRGLHKHGDRAAAKAEVHAPGGRS